jgi:DNA polymerase (family 10)
VSILPDTAAVLAELTDLAEIRGIPVSAEAMHDSLAQLGADAVRRASLGRVPWLIRRLRELSVLSPKQAAALVRQLGVLTLADLTAALDEGRVRSVLGELLEGDLRQATRALGIEQQPLNVGRAWDLLEPVLTEVSLACPTLENLIPAGDVRRCEPLVSGLVLVGRSTDPSSAIDALCASRALDDVLHRGGRRAIVLTAQTEIDVRVAAPEDHGTVLFKATGSRAHLAAVHARRAMRQPAAREEDVYRHAGLPYIPAELRNATGEIEAAAANTLPTLVEQSQIRGDLHMHTTYSDGRDTLDVMVAACHALGYEYIAITDHSESAAASRTVTIEQLAQQKDEILRLRERYPSMAILQGIEVDILTDGRLDFPDAVLEGLDIVLASLHDPSTHDGRKLTKRCINAIRHPLVNVITHPANRLVGRREGYDLDFDAVFHAAAETGTALEIDGAPSHLDLDGEHARRAVNAGVTVTVDSDCHRAVALGRQMGFAVGTARRGWVEPHRVLNVRSLAGLRAFIAAKRTRRG